MRRRATLIAILYLLVDGLWHVASQAQTAAQGGISAQPGQLVFRPSPVYPLYAKAAHVTGPVVLRLTIDPSGHASKGEVVSGPFALREPTISAVRRWAYKPYVLNGVPTAYDLFITADFEIPRNAAINAGQPAGQIILQQTVAETPRPPKPVAADFCGGTGAGVAETYKRVSDAVMQGLLLKKVEPAYPAGQGWGAISVEVCVSSAGVVERAQAFDGPEGLRGAVASAVSQWAYRAFEVNGAAVPVETTVMLSQGLN